MLFELPWNLPEREAERSERITAEWIDAETKRVAQVSLAAGRETGVPDRLLDRYVDHGGHHTLDEPRPGGQRHRGAFVGFGRARRRHLLSLNDALMCRARFRRFPMERKRRSAGKSDSYRQGQHCRHGSDSSDHRALPALRGMSGAGASANSAVYLDGPPDLQIQRAPLTHRDEREPRIGFRKSSCVTKRT
jgi:hypothetical protein